MPWGVKLAGMGMEDGGETEFPFPVASSKFLQRDLADPFVLKCWNVRPDSILSHSFLKRLEPLAGKLAWAVLRGLPYREVGRLPDLAEISLSAFMHDINYFISRHTQVYPFYI